jgi:cell division protein FtsQ
VAKIDSYTSRGSAIPPQRAGVEGNAASTRRAESSVLVEDDPLDPFYRPATPSRPRAGKQPAKKREEEFPATDAADLEDEPFLRARRRVPVRKGVLPKSRWGRIAFAAGVVAVLGLVFAIVMAVRGFLFHDARFRIASSSSIQILGNSEVTRPQLLSVFGSDIGGNIFKADLGQRRQELESLPWVEHATVMRVLPDQLRVAITERTPIAFVRLGNEIGLVDANGVILGMSAAAIAAHHYSFPVLEGIAPSDPLSTRAARMKLYQRFVADIDSGSEKISPQLSEVDLSDPEDVRVLVPAQGSDILLHLGDQDFLTRFRNYQAHLAEWQQQYPKLASVDLRYERQVVLEMQKGAELPPAQDKGQRSLDQLRADATSVSARTARIEAAKGHIKPAKTKAAAKPKKAGVKR